MSELALAVYGTEDTAEHVLGVLRAHEEELPVDLDSAGIVRIRADGGFAVITTDRPGSGSSFWGVFWEAFFGLVLRVPTAGTSYGENLGGLFGAIDRAGLDADFRDRVRCALGRGCSGLGLIATNWEPEPLLNQVFLRPGSLLRASLSVEQDWELVRELGGIPTDAP
jgi:uncharacterized membrane protein